MVSLPRNNRYSFVLVMEYIGRSRTELGIMITFILQEIKGTSLTLADNSAKLNIVNVIFSISFLKKKKHISPKILTHTNLYRELYHICAKYHFPRKTEQQIPVYLLIFKGIRLKSF